MDDPLVFRPGTIGEALQTLRKHPDAVLWGGGTWFMAPDGRWPEGTVPSVVVLSGIREMRRVVRSQAFIDLGGAVTIGRLRDLSPGSLPAIVRACADASAPPPLDNLVTLGGALATPRSIAPLAAALTVADARVELRRPGGSRWIPVPQLRGDEGDLDLVPEEVVTRIRVPIAERSRSMLRTFAGASDHAPELTVALLARVDREVVATVRAVAIARGEATLRARDAESDLGGRRIPLTGRERRSFVAQFEALPAYGTHLNDLGRARLSNAVDEFLRSLSVV